MRRCRYELDTGNSDARADPNLYMAGGGCAHARYFPRFIALQMQSQKLGHPIRPYLGTEAS